MTCNNQSKSSEKTRDINLKRLDFEQNLFNAGAFNQQQNNYTHNETLHLLDQASSENLFQIIYNQRNDKLSKKWKNVNCSLNHEFNADNCSITLVNEKQQSSSKTYSVNIDNLSRNGHKSPKGITYMNAYSMPNLFQEFDEDVIKIKKISSLNALQYESSNHLDSLICPGVFYLSDNPLDLKISRTFPSLHSLDELSEMLKQKEGLIHREPDLDESFVTVNGCKRDQSAATDNIAIASIRNHQIENSVLVRGANEYDTRPPPPYSVHSIPSYARRDQNYQNPTDPVPVYYYQQSQPRDAARAPPYQFNDPEITANLFDDALIRKQFVAKVYTILGLQLFFTFLFIFFCNFHKPAKLFFLRHYSILTMTSLIILFTLLIVFTCFQSSRRIVPLNFILLTIFTIAMAVMAATATCIYNTYIVLLSFGVTAAVCFTVTFIACLPCFDITGHFIYLFIAGTYIAYMIYAGLATVLFSFYLIFDTQQLMAGKRVQLSPEEYVLGAISLYVDIITIFLYILAIFGHR